tara:strand:- start:238 stop:834 length:597 start_codon:yes stop_codon:yes gene_type:complete
MLQCIISALKAEAEPLANYYGLKQNLSYDYPFYGTDEMKIICTGVGRKNINDVLVNFSQRIPINTQTQFINVGIAGGKKNKCKIGECFIVDNVYDDKSERVFNLNNKFESHCSTQNITTVSNPVSDGGASYGTLVDMEAHEICRTISKFGLEDNLLIVKIVSDFMDISKEDFSYKRVYDLVENNLNNINRLLNAFRNN